MTTNIALSDTNPKANLFQKHLHRHTQIYALPAMWASLGQIKLTQKIICHIAISMSAKLLRIIENSFKYTYFTKDRVT